MTMHAKLIIMYTVSSCLDGITLILVLIPKAPNARIARWRKANQTAMSCVIMTDD